MQTADCHLKLQVTVTKSKGKTPQSGPEVHDKMRPPAGRPVLPQTGWTPYAHTLTGLHLLWMPWATPGPGPGISSEGVRVYSAPTGAHRGTTASSLGLRPKPHGTSSALDTRH